MPLAAVGPPDGGGNDVRESAGRGAKGSSCRRSRAPSSCRSFADVSGVLHSRDSSATCSRDSKLNLKRSKYCSNQMFSARRW